MQNFEDKVIQVISKLICDGCGEQATLEDYEFHEFISTNHKCGYGSIHGDGNQLSIDLCQQCFSDTCGDSLTIIDSSDEKDDSDSSIAVKDILLANEIINKEELDVALRRVERIFGPQQLSNTGSEFYQLAGLVYDYEGKNWDSYFDSVDGASSDFMEDREDTIEQRGSANGILSGIQVNSSFNEDESLESGIDEGLSIIQGLPEEKVKLLAIIAKIWTQYPDLRLTQLIVNAIPAKLQHSEIFYVEDSEIINKLKQLLIN